MTGGTEEGSGLNKTGESRSDLNNMGLPGGQIRPGRRLNRGTPDDPPPTYTPLEHQSHREEGNRTGTGPEIPRSLRLKDFLR